ncbi:ORF6N domain-containing protein [Niabella hibiscisoli]|uniref:ORF6N domain-containing protein n=1 Tax=Niabella hibiscisoli TaxID=1825928 RepID=UPI001F0DD88B|nr:ORF6N domain-containing protein [Niabella hibiscisoli]MCH5717556.1 ORF6N domain-containing protein [Niabella hibiscisoli]
MQVIQSIQNRIYEIRGERVMLDFDLAALYEIETRIFNQAVKRNIKRFPKDFMFQLTRQEWADLKSKATILNLQDAKNQYNMGMSSQIVTTLRTTRPSKAIPYAFTEQGVAMLSGILNSDRAIQMSQIYDALENLLDEKAAERKWENRERIGFKKQNDKGIL